MIRHFSGLPPSRPCVGFTLVEMIVVIVISGIIAAFLGVIIVRPIEGYEAQVRRAELVDAAESALRRMQRDIRAALPNSVRIRTNGATVGDATCPNGLDTVCVIEILHSVDGGRYRADPPGNNNARFQFGVVETDFDIVGSLQNFGAIDTANHWLVINNQTTTGTQFNAYFGDNRASLNTGTTATHINLDGFNFPATLASPRQRFYIVDTPVTYRCDTTAGTLDRHQGYPIAAGQVATPAGAPARVANLVAGCRFTYVAGAAERAGLVTLALTLRSPADANEPVNLLHQVHVYNAP